MTIPITTANTIIIGGGIAGLYAATKLYQKGVDFVLLEAKPSLGGRIISHPSASTKNMALDLGPTWFWPHQPRIRQLISDLNLDWFEQYCKGDVLYQMSRDQPVTRHAGAGSMQSFKVVGGMQTIIHALAEQIDDELIKCEHPVTSAVRHADDWKVTTKSENSQTTFSAKNLIMALPPRQIVQHLGPDEYLSATLCIALKSQQTWMSAQAKFVAEFETPFWRSEGLAGQAFSRVGPMVEIHDACSSIQSAHALFGFIGLAAANRFEMTSKQLSEACIEQLVRIFGDQAATPNNTHLKDWAKDPWISTKLDIGEPPKHAEFNMAKHQQELSSLNLMLVGSEFAHNEPGYIEGALEAVEAAIRDDHGGN